MKMNLIGAIEILKLHKHTTDKFKHSIGDAYVSEAIDTVVEYCEQKTYTAKETQDFAEWCMKNYKRMHDMNEYKERFDNDPSGKRYNISNLRELWEQERRIK